MLATRSGWAARNFRITAVLQQEPDRISAGAGMGPRVMISNAALDRTGLVAPGSRASHRLLMKLPAQVDDATVRKKVEEVLPDAQVMDFKEGNPALSQGLDNATSILSLICLVAMVLGAIGVAMAMHAHLEQRMDMLAILKAVGARSSDLLRIFLLQTMALGLRGSADWRWLWCAGDGGAAGGLRQAAARSYGAAFPVARGWSGIGNGFADDACCSAFRRCWTCGRSGRFWCCAGWSSRDQQPRRSGLRAGGRGGCSLGSPWWWSWRWARLHGRCRIQ